MQKFLLATAWLSALFLWQAIDSTQAIAADPKPLIQTKHVYQERDGKKCNFTNGCVVAGESLHINLDQVSFHNGKTPKDNAQAYVRLIGKEGCNGWPDLNFNWVESGSCGVGGSGVGWTSILTGKWMGCKINNGKVDLVIPGNQIKPGCAYDVEVHLSNDDYPDGSPMPDGKGTPNNTGAIARSVSAAVQCSPDQCNEDLDANSSYELCKQINTSTPQYGACMDCFSKDGVWTAVGCIPNNPQGVIKAVVTIGLGLSGGVVLIMILVGAAMLSVSQGDPNKTKEAQEIITSAIIGLVFIIFSVTILQFVGVSVLRIPGFGG